MGEIAIVGGGRSVSYTARRRRPSCSAPAAPCSWRCTCTRPCRPASREECSGRAENTSDLKCMFRTLSPCILVKDRVCSHFWTLPVFWSLARMGRSPSLRQLMAGEGYPSALHSRLAVSPCCSSRSVVDCVMSGGTITSRYAVCQKGRFDCDF